MYHFLSIILNLTSFCLAAEVKFEDAVQIKKTDQSEFTTLSSDQSLQIEKDDSYFILGSKNVPLLVVSSHRQSQIKVLNSDFNQIFEARTNSLIEAKTNEIIAGLRKAESLLLKKEFSTALGVIQPLKEKYKNISSVLFLSGTIHSLMNNKKLAVEDLEAGLKIDPQNSSAQNMIKSLKGVTQ